MRSFVTTVASLGLMLGASFSSPAQARIDNCSVNLQHHVRIEPQSVVFIPTGGSDTEFVLSNGTLRIDGQSIPLDSVDAEMLRLYEQEVRELFVEFKGVALEAMDLVEDVLVHVLPLTALDPNSAPIALPARARESLNTIRQEIINAQASNDIDEQRIRELGQSLVRDLMPMFIARVSALAMKAALTGDEAMIADIEARAERLEATLEERTRERGEALEARVEALCPRFDALREIENTLAWQPQQGNGFRLLSK